MFIGVLLRNQFVLVGIISVGVTKIWVSRKEDLLA